MPQVVLDFMRRVATLVESAKGSLASHYEGQVNEAQQELKTLISATLADDMTFWTTRQRKMTWPTFAKEAKENLEGLDPNKVEVGYKTLETQLKKLPEFKLPFGEELPGVTKQNATNLMNQAKATNTIGVLVSLIETPLNDKVGQHRALQKHGKVAKAQGVADFMPAVLLAQLGKALQA